MTRRWRSNLAFGTIDEIDETCVSEGCALENSETTRCTYAHARDTTRALVRVR